MRSLLIFAGVLGILSLSGCDADSGSADFKQREQQDLLLSEATSQVGMPAIKNFRERKMMKDILELRDQQGLTTYTYLYSEMTGKLIYFGETIGYGLPYATQFTNPQRPVGGSSSYVALPQADPNGLFSPQSAEGTWVLLKDPHGSEVKPVYVEPRIVVSPFRLQQ